MPDRVALTIDGTGHEGWTSVAVTLSIETIAGSYELGVTERWADQPEPVRIRIGQRCTLAIGSETVVTGHVDDFEPSYDATTHSIVVRGRDATGDLVDCAAVHSPGEWAGLTVAGLARVIARPFGIAVRQEVDTGKPFTRFSLQPGETAFEAIDRACRARAVLPVSDGAGSLLLTRAGSARRQTALVLGENVIAGRGAFSDRERFATYIVRGQQPGDDSWPGAVAASPEGRARDPGIGRYRPLIVIAETPEGQSFADRARWEASVRAGRSQRAEYVVQGWRDGAGNLWRPNALVEVRDGWLGIAGTMLIASVALQLDEQGMRSVLSLVHPGAFELFPEREHEESGPWNLPAFVD